jgi:hypothetical protein
MNEVDPLGCTSAMSMFEAPKCRTKIKMLENQHFAQLVCKAKLTRGHSQNGDGVTT